MRVRESHWDNPKPFFFPSKFLFLLSFISFPSPYLFFFHKNNKDRYAVEILRINKMIKQTVPSKRDSLWEVAWAQLILVFCDNLEKRDGVSSCRGGLGERDTRYFWLIHDVIWQKPTQYCKPNYPSIKNKLKKSKQTVMINTPSLLRERQYKSTHSLFFPKLMN